MFLISQPLLVLQARQLLLVMLIPRLLLLAVTAQHVLGGAGDLLRRRAPPAMTPRRPCSGGVLHVERLELLLLRLLLLR